MRQELRALTPPVSQRKPCFEEWQYTSLSVFNKWELRQSGSGSLHLKYEFCSSVLHEQLLQNLARLWRKSSYRNFLNTPNSTQSRQIPIWLIKHMEIQLDCNSSGKCKGRFLTTDFWEQGGLDSSHLSPVGMTYTLQMPLTSLYLNKGPSYLFSQKHPKAGQEESHPDWNWSPCNHKIVFSEAT